MNFVQYIDDTYSLKTKEINLDFHPFLSVKGIETPYFLISVFLSSKKVSEIEFDGYDNMNMLAVINDLGDTDLNCIPLNYFAQPYQEVRMKYLGTPVPAVSAYIENFPVPDTKIIKKYEVPFLMMDDRFFNNNNGDWWSFNYNLFAYKRVAFIPATKNTQDLTYLNFYNNLPSYALDSGEIQKNKDYGFLNNSVNATLVPPYVYPNSNFPLRASAEWSQISDFYLKITSHVDNVYGQQIEIFHNVLTNEIWLTYHNPVQVGNGFNGQEVFDYKTFTITDGGFSIKSKDGKCTVLISSKRA